MVCRRSYFCAALVAFAIALVPNRTVGAEEEPDEAAPEVLQLEEFTYWMHIRGPDHVKPALTAKGMLVRELFRQSLLLAANYDFGLTIRDAALGEACKAEENVREIMLLTDRVREIKFPKQIPPHMDVVVKAGRDELLRVTEPAIDWGDLDYTAIVEIADRMRSAEFANMLRELGGEPIECPYDDADLALPPRVEELLEKMDMVSQFAALRSIDSSFVAQGESPGKLGGLIRGYSNLALLTSHHWHGAHKVFKARALLLAERLRQRHGDNDFSRAHRAYARAIAGMHAAALDDFSALEERTDDSGIAEIPSWASTAEAYCRYDAMKLDELSTDNDVGPLAHLLWFFVVEHPDAKTATVEAAMRVIGDMPDCFVIYDLACPYGDVSDLHYLTSYPLLRFGPATYDSILSGSGAPEAPMTIAAQALRKFQAAGANFDDQILFDDFEARRQLVESLHAAADEPLDTTTPSWGALGRLILEENFVQVWRRADFFRYSLAVETDAFISAAEPLTRNHPLQVLLELLLTNKTERSEELQRYLRRRVMPQYFDWSHDELRRPLYYADELFSTGFRYIADYNSDDLLMPDYLNWLRGMRKSLQGKSSDELLKPSPHSPHIASILITHEIEEDVEKWKQWEAKFHQHPGVLGALANGYLKREMPLEAERCLKALIARTSDYMAYRQLADVYAQRGDMELWRQTLDEYIETAAPTLHRARAQVNIANHLMQNGDYEAALPYVEEAAPSYSAWAMIAASNCYEGLGDYEQSELWIQRRAMRYDNSRLDWYLWCLRTGRGDLEAAKQLAHQSIAAFDGRDTSMQLANGGFLLLAEGKRDEARKLLSRSFKATTYPFSGLHLAVIAGEDEDVNERDAVLKQLAEISPPKDIENPYINPVIPTARALLKQYQEAGDLSQLDITEIEEILKDVTGPDRANAAFLAGRLLELDGREEAGAKLLEVAADCGPSAFCGFLARQHIDLRAKSNAESNEPAKETAQAAE